MPTQSPTDTLLLLLQRAYEPILVIEQALGIVVSAVDYRPRIEHFHDAIRAYASGDVAIHAANTRLSVEKLAMDAKALKAIQEAPIHPNHTHRRPSPNQALAPVGSPSGMHPSEARTKLGECYKTYGVLFMALLADAADRNFQARTDTKNAQMEEIGVLESEVKRAGQAPVDLNSLVHEHVWDQDLKNFLLHRLNQQNAAKKKLATKDALTFLKTAGKAIDATILAMEKAHMAFGSVQLVFYEQSKDVVKNMALQGLNIAGKFLADALGAAMRGRGGPGR